MGKGDRKRRARTNVVAKARRSTTSRTPMIITAVVVLVLAAAVVGGALWVSAHKAATAAQPIPTVTTAPDSVAVSLNRDDGTVLVGPASAKVTLDVYEDFLCPVCRQFEQDYSDQLHDKLTSGAVRIRYHMINLLDSRSDPPGYSLHAANAALALADVAPNRFLDFHDSLYAAQPKEGARGYADEELVDLGNRLGVSDPRFTDQTKSGTFNTQIQHDLSAAEADPALRRTDPGGASGFGTPTVAVNGKLVDTSDRSWLSKLTAQPDAG